jgi:pyruvate/2-oxoglutarate dehydrogenase complex dihydrolipoamide dehydrogenase (E3) component
MTSAQTPLEFEVVVIGGGCAGYSAARAAAAGGLKTAVIEGGREVGGLCILRGCMPSKALLYAAEVLHLARHGKTWGLDIPRAGFNFTEVMARKKAMVQEFADFRREQLSGGKFAFLRANAAFLNPHTLALDDGRTVTARNFIISTGSSVAPPPRGDLAETGYWTSDDALEAAAPPRSLIVLGGGAVGVELAQFYARLDCAVTLLQRGPRILRGFDEDLAAELEGALRADGMRIFTETSIEKIERVGGLKRVSFRHKNQVVQAEAEEILHALGRVPNIGGLALEKAGVALDGGRIRTDAGMRTSAPHIFAAGDCAGPHEIVHVAVRQGEVAAHNILHPERPLEMDERLLINVVFTDPQAASVGLTEKAARKVGAPYLAAGHPFSDHGKSLIMEAKIGFVKLLAHPQSGEILGGAVLGPTGGELIHEIVAAMAGRMTVGGLAAMPHYHPTLAEIWTYPAEELAEKIVRLR